MLITKEFKTFDEQIAGLVGRKLKFKSKSKAKKILQKYNYFDIVNGFETILLKSGILGKEYENVYFEDFYELYKFDMNLKKYTLFKVFDVESRMRTSISYHFASVHCNTIASTMNYINPACYQSPSPTDTYLTNKFNHFDLFRTEVRDASGKVTQKSFIDGLKSDKPYVAQYVDPPFWVVIKSLPLGSLYFTYLFLDNNVKTLVLNDFNFLPTQSKIYEQAIYLLKEVRNQCAHLELLTRFKLKRTPKLNFFNDVTCFASLSRSDLNYMDVLKVFKMFGSILDIKWIIIKFYIKMCIKGRRKIALKILGKMGKKDIWSWIRL